METKILVYPQDEYREIKADLRVWFSTLVALIAFWLALNSAFFGALLAYEDKIQDSFWLKFWLGFMAFFLNVTVYLYILELRLRYHRQTMWIQNSVNGYAPIPKMRLTEWACRLVGIVLIIVWGSYWLPMFSNIITALPNFPLG